MQTELDKPEVIHNLAENRFEIKLGEGLAVLDYFESGNTITMLHVGVPHAYRGQGVAAIIAKAALEYARARSLRVIPVCSYVSAYLRRNPQYMELTK